MKAILSVMDSITEVALALSVPGFEPSPAHASRACPSNKPMARALIAIVIRDQFALIIFTPSFEYCENVLRR
jgi:hypothetical protein